MAPHQLVGHRLIVSTGRHATPFGWRLDGGRARETLFRPGQFALQSHGDTNAPRWDGPFEFMALALEPDFVADVAGEDNGSVAGAIEFQPRRGESDPVIARYAGAFQTELAHGNPNGALYAETLATGLALHLLAHHGAQRSRTRPPRGKLTAFQVRRVVDYVQAHLREPFGLAEMAIQANLSPFHFARLFRATVGVPPHRFVLRLRVDRARRMLARRRVGRPSLAQVALAVGFYDQAHLTHTLRRFLDTTPQTIVSDVGRTAG